MRTLKDIYPEYAGKAEILVIGIDPLEDRRDLDQFRQEQGYPFPVFDTNAELVKALDVRIRSTKFAVDENGVILRREGYGGVSVDDWRQWLNDATE